jgi:hypothetical protein
MHTAPDFNRFFVAHDDQLRFKMWCCSG